MFCDESVVRGGESIGGLFKVPSPFLAPLFRSNIPTSLESGLSHASLLKTALGAAMGEP
jgi:hypothetical protein